VEKSVGVFLQHGALHPEKCPELLKAGRIFCKKFQGFLVVVGRGSIHCGNTGLESFQVLFVFTNEPAFPQ